MDGIRGGSRVQRMKASAASSAGGGGTAGAPSPAANAPRQQQADESEHEIKHIHVHHFKGTKLFGAWVNDPTVRGKKKRVYCGSHRTAYLAARAQDRAALKFKPHAVDPNTIHLNFKEEDYDADEELRNMLTNEEFGTLLCKESRPSYTKMEPTPCLKQFMDEERRSGNLIEERAKPVKVTLQEYLDGVISSRGNAPRPMHDFTLEWGVRRPRSASQRVAPAVPAEPVRAAVVVRPHRANRASASAAAPEAVGLRRQTSHSNPQTAQPAAPPALEAVVVPRKKRKRKVKTAQPTDLPASSSASAPEPTAPALWSGLELDVASALEVLRRL